MSWWLKIRAPWALVITSAVTVCVGLVVGEAELPIPILTGQSGGFLMGHLVPVLPAVVLMHGIGRADRRLETVATRPINRWDTALGLSVAALSAVTAIGVDLSLDKDIALVIGRNTAGYIGIAMLVAAFLGTRTAALLTTVVPLVLGATGWTPAGAPRHWAWLLHPAHSSLAFLMTALALAAGASATCVRRGPLRGL